MSLCLHYSRKGQIDCCNTPTVLGMVGCHFTAYFTLVPLTIPVSNSTNLFMVLFTMMNTYNPTILIPCQVCKCRLIWKSSAGTVIVISELQQKAYQLLIFTVLLPGCIHVRHSAEILWSLGPWDLWIIDKGKHYITILSKFEVQHEYATIYGNWLCTKCEHALTCSSISWFPNWFEGHLQQGTCVWVQGTVLFLAEVESSFGQQWSYN